MFTLFSDITTCLSMSAAKLSDLGLEKEPYRAMLCLEAPATAPNLQSVLMEIQARGLKRKTVSLQSPVSQPGFSRGKPDPELNDSSTQSHSLGRLFQELRGMARAMRRSTPRIWPILRHAGSTTLQRLSRKKTYPSDHALDNEVPAKEVVNAADAGPHTTSPSINASWPVVDTTETGQDELDTCHILPSSTPWHPERFSEEMHPWGWFGLSPAQMARQNLYLERRLTKVLEWERITAMITGNASTNF